MKGFLAAWSFLIVCLLFPLRSYAFPEGQLYWLVVNYPSHFVVYDISCSDGYQCAKDALIYACQQYSGSAGTFTSAIDMDNYANNFPAQKGGWCINHTSYGDFDGEYYLANLYCNGEKRIDPLDDSSCAMPPSPFADANNLGSCQSE